MNHSKAILDLKSRMVLHGARGSNKKKLRKKPPRWLPPSAAERNYLKILRESLSDVYSAYARFVLPRMPALAREAASLKEDSKRMDAWADAVAGYLAQMKEQVKSKAKRAEASTGEIAGQVSAWNKAEWRKITNAVVGVDVTKAEPWLIPELKSWAYENAGLITSLEDKAVQQVEQWTMKGLREGMRHEEIGKMISERFEVSDKHAKFIARDQVSKLNGSLTQNRQRAAGVDSYVWRCLGPDVRVKAIDALAVSRRWHEGHMIKITGASGLTITLTPEHKVLTRRGWIRSDHLHCGDDLISYKPEIENAIARISSSGADSVLFNKSLGMPDIDNMPPKISELFSSLHDSASRSGAVCRIVDFDSKGGDGKIEVVPIYGKLQCDIEASIPEGLSEIALEITDLRLGSLFSDAHRFNLGIRAGAVPEGTKMSSPFDFDIRGFFGGPKDSSLGMVSSFDPASLKHGENSGLTTPILDGETPSAYSAGVLFGYDACAIIEVIPFSGHVYDLRTKLKWFAADSFVVHNSSSDERVRPTHAAHDGKEYKWTDPPANTGHPSEDYQCRCSAEPVLDGLLEGLNNEEEEG